MSIIITAIAFIPGRSFCMHAGMFTLGGVLDRSQNQTSGLIDSMI
jgi:hypothetical protein